METVPGSPCLFRSRQSMSTVLIFLKQGRPRHMEEGSASLQYAEDRQSILYRHAVHACSGGRQSMFPWVRQSMYVLKDGSDIYSGDKQSMSILETGSPFIFLKLAVYVVWSKAVHDNNSILKTSSLYSENRQNGSLCLFWIKAVNVYPWDRQSMCTLETGS